MEQKENLNENENEINIENKNLTISEVEIISSSPNSPSSIHFKSSNATNSSTTTNSSYFGKKNEKALQILGCSPSLLKLSKYYDIDITTLNNLDEIQKNFLQEKYNLEASRLTESEKKKFHNAGPKALQLLGVDLQNQKLMNVLGIENETELKEEIARAKFRTIEEDTDSLQLTIQNLEPRSQQKILRLFGVEENSEIRPTEFC
eukprot:TRINITY_DN284_c0_g1_i1.p1 TRINITY_DN284_c0_g1~~TRINITY_DN284_c0_g1_i1.p1  ORF type:complete len:204 (-),score=93.60 TRINITY_DN284_c0_g1_i1:11-622(-)